MFRQEGRFGTTGICIIILPIILTGCFGMRPVNPEDICDIFRKNRKWYQHTYMSCRKWGVPIPLMMAIMYHESEFEAEARPPRTTCLLIFPGPRPSTAYGYAQALDGTWEMYKRSTGAEGAERDNFADAIDFIGWYCEQSRRMCGISKKDPYNLYLAYHEGQTGFRQKTYKNKGWLKQKARKVRNRTNIYAGQLRTCEKEFQKPEGKCIGVR